MYEKIAKWYNQGLWSDEMVQVAVQKGIITQKQANKIVKQR